MKNHQRFLVTVVAAAFVVAGCSNQSSNPGTTVVKLLTHDSFVASKEALKSFRDETGIKIDIVTAGDAGTMVAGAVLASGSPTADVMFGIDNSLMPNALKGDGMFVAYKSPLLTDVRPDLMQWTDQNLVTPIDYADVCVNVDLKWFMKSGLPIPASIDVLTLPQYKNLLVVEDPATSSPGMAFLLAVHARLGTDRLAYWEGLKANGVKIAASWSDAYFNDFTAGGGNGKYPLVVSVPVALHMRQSNAPAIVCNPPVFWSEKEMPTPLAITALENSAAL